MPKETTEKRAKNEQEKPTEQLTHKKDISQEKETRDLATALAKEKERSEEYLNRLKYMQADFENMKKRHERQLDEVRKYSNERLILEVLGIADELEIAVRESKRTPTVETLRTGVEMTLKKLKKVLELDQVTPIDCLGEAFDPSKHEVAAKIPSEEDEGKILEEIRKGYTMKGRVIRPSIVKIAVNPTSKSLQEERTHEQEANK